MTTGFQLVLDTMTEDFNNQLSEVQELVDSIGPTVEVFTVSRPVNPGDLIHDDDIIKMPYPSSLLQENAITDIEELRGKSWRIGLNLGTMITRDLIREDRINNTTREESINLEYMPIGLKIGDYIDVKVTYPFGQTFLVLSQKRVIDINGGSIMLHLDQTEQHTIKGLKLDLYLFNSFGMYSYASKYVEPGVQTPATAFYVVPEVIVQMLAIDPNMIDILNEAAALSARDFQEALMDPELFGMEDDEMMAALRSGVSAEIQKQIQAYEAKARKMEDEARDAETNDPHGVGTVEEPLYAEEWSPY